ncbi:MAG: DNA-directed RNA polymerase subunit beta, partial [Bacteroidetes bacterium SW_10_40_5]
DHLSNRRVRTVGEQLYNQFGVGLNRMARTIRERMNVRDNEVFTPTDLINSRTLSSVINSFFGTNQLSQFMDQNNPLAEMTHKKRLSALGPGGLSRERAGFEVRDVHYTHYGRLCTIETPEGPNIGLISSMSQANAPLNEDGSFQNDRVMARSGGDFIITEKENIDYMDVSPNQIVSIAASLIPFLEHNDANRALMGSNMQRQALPLLKTESPIVGTGIEENVARDSRTFITAEYDGVIDYVDAQKIIVKYERSEQDELVAFDDNTKTYDLTKFKRSNQSSCINIQPIVNKGDHVKKNQVLCDGFGTDNGELALGRNLKVAFMPWQGYNYEDAIVVSERVVKDDLFSSMHITEFDLDV